MSNFDEGAVAKRAADPSAGMGSRGTQRRVPPRQLLPDALWSLLAASGGVHRSGAMRFGGMSMGTSVVFSAVLRFVLVLMCGMIGVAWSADMPPLVAAPAMATPANVAGRTTKLTVLGADDGGAANLRYAWSAEGPALVTFSSTNDTASGRTVTATFRAVGDYHLTATITDGSGQAITSTVPVTVSATLTSLAISPSTAAVNPLATRAFAATAKNQFGVAMSDVSFTWTAAGSGVVDAFGLFTAGGEPGAASVTVSAGEKTAAAAIRVNAAPTVATAAAIDTPVVHGTTAVCTIQGGDDASVDELTYTWSAAGPASVSFAPRSSRQGETTTATFRAAGEYVITATITDKEGLATTSTTVATVLQTAVSLAVSPSRNVVVNPGLTKPFVAAVRDQFNDLMVPQPIVEWDVTTGNGSIGSDGVYVAGDPGYATITASVGTVRGGATLRINAPPTVVQAVATDTTTITGLTAVFTVQGADDVDPSLLSYSWAASGPKSVSFSPRTGVTAASTTATFTCAGAYTITSTIVDKQGLKTTSSLAVHVLQVPTSFGLHPASAILNPRAAKAFVVQVRDQYQATIAGAVAPAATWSATGGSIDGAGRYVAGATPGSGTVLAVVETDAGPVTLEAVVRINAPPSIVSPAATSGPNPTDVGTIPLVVLGADDGGAANLRYVWSVVGGNASGVMFDGATQNTTAAQHIVATVPGPGSYQFRVLVRDAQGLSATSDVTVAVQHAPGASDPPRVPTPTLVISAGLSGDRHATVGDEVWWFTNQPQITVTMLPGITDDADVSETWLLASGGDVVQRDSTTWDIVSLPESRIDLSAEVRVVKNGQSAIGATTSPTIIISDRTPPRLRWRMPGSTGPVGQGLPSDGGNVLRLCGEASDVERIRSTYGWLVWAKSDFAIEADIDDLAGVADTATPIATVGGGAPRAALVPDPANPQMRILRLDHFGGVPDTIEVSDDLTVSQAEVASLRVVLPDRCGNALSADQLSMMVKTTPAAIRAGYVPWNRDDFPSDIGVWPPNAAVDLSAVCLVATAADVVAVEQRVGAMAYPARRLTASPATCAQLAGAGPVLWALAQPGWASGLDDTIVVVARTMDVVGNVSGDQHIRATRTWHQVALPHPGDDETLTQVVAAHDADIQTIRHYDFWNVNRVEWWLGVDVAMPLYGTRVFGDDIQSGFIEMRQWSHLSLDPNPVAVVTTRSIPARIDLREQPLSGASIGVVFMPGEYQPVRRFISGASDGRGRFHQMAGLAPTYSIEADNPYLFFDKDGEALRGHVVDDAARFVDVDENGQYVFPANWPKRVSPTRQWRGFELRVGEELPVESRRMVERYMRCMPGVSEEYNFFERYPFRAAYMIEEREQISGDPMDGLYRWNAYLDVPRIASVPASWSTSPLRLERVRVADRGVLTGPWREHEADRIAGADGRLDVVVGRDLPGGYYRLQHDAMAGGPETRIAQQCGFRSLNLVKVDRDVVVAGAVSSCEVSAAFLDSLPMPGSALLPPGSAVRIYASDRRALAEGRLRESGIGIGAWMQELRQSLEESVGLIGASSGTAHASVEDALLRACEMSAVRGVLMPHGVDSWEMLVQQWFDVAPDASLLEQGLTRQMIAVSADEVRVADDLMRGSEDALLSYRRTHGGWNASAAADAARRRGDAALTATVAVSRLGHGRGIYAMAVDDALRPYRDRLNAIETNLQELAVQRNAMCEMILDLQDDVIRQVHDVFNDETNIHEMTNMVYSDGDHVLYAYDEWFYGGYRIEDELFLSMWDDIAVHARALQDERDGIHADERYLVLKRAEAHAKSAITPYAADTSSVIDAFSSRSYLPLPLESRVSVIGLHMRADEPSSPLSQVLIAHMDVGSRASGMYDLSISCGLIGANGAHRMKEALAVVKMGYETEDQQNATVITKSHAVPKLQVNSWGSSSVSLDGDYINISLSGSVDDKAAGLVASSSLNTVYVNVDGAQAGTIPLQRSGGNGSKFAPYGTHFTFSGSVQIPKTSGTHTVELVTNLNDLGENARAETEFTVKAKLPADDGSGSGSGYVAMPFEFPAAFTVEQPETMALVLPNLDPQQPATTIPLIESGNDTLQFQNDPVTVRVALLEAPSLDPQAVDVVYGTVLLGGTTFDEVALTETAIDSRVFVAAMPISTIGGTMPEPTWSVGAVNAMRVAGGDEGWGWQPYLIKLEGPSQIIDKMVEEDRVYHNGRKLKMKKDGDVYYATGFGESGGGGVAVAAMASPMGGGGETNGNEGGGDEKPMPFLDSQATPPIVTPMARYDTTRRLTTDNPSDSLWWNAGGGYKAYKGRIGTLDVHLWVDTTILGTNPPPATLAVSVTADTGSSGMAAVGVQIDGKEASIGTAFLTMNAARMERVAGRHFDAVVCSTGVMPTNASGTLTAMANAEAASLVEYTKVQWPTGSQDWVWNSNSLDGVYAEPGWVWNPKDISYLVKDRVPLWTLPEGEGGSKTLPETLKVYFNVTDADLDPTATDETKIKKRAVFNAFVIEIQRGTINHWGLGKVDGGQPVGRAVFNWLVNDIIKTYSVADEQADLGKPAAQRLGVKAGQVKREFLRWPGYFNLHDQLGQYAGNPEVTREKSDRYWKLMGNLYFDSEKRLVDAVAQTTSVLTQISDPFTYLSYLTGGEGIQVPADGEGTWTGVLIDGASLVADKLLVGAGKAAKVAYKWGVPRGAQASVKAGLDALGDVAHHEANVVIAAVKGGMCFTAGTKIRTDGGWKPIEQVAIGDRVWSRSEATGEEGLRPVTEVYVTHPAALVHLRYTRAGHQRGGDHGGDADGDDDAEIIGTPAHPFWVAERRAFVPMGQLQVGYHLALPGGQLAVVTGVSAVAVAEGAAVTTYNFAVAGWNTYFAAGNGSGLDFVWVHNLGEICEKAIAKAKAIYHGGTDLEGKVHVPKGKRMFDFAPFKGFTWAQKWAVVKGDIKYRRPSVDNRWLDANKTLPHHPTSSEWVDKEFEYFFSADYIAAHPDVVKLGKSVKLKANGFPDFSPFVHKAKGVDCEVNINVLSTFPGRKGRDRDYFEATKAMREKLRLAGDPAANTWNPPAGYSWHHSEDLGVMQLVPSSLNDKAFPHNGGRTIADDLIAEGLYP